MRRRHLSLLCAGGLILGAASPVNDRFERAAALETLEGTGNLRDAFNAEGMGVSCNTVKGDDDPAQTRDLSLSPALIRWIEEHFELAKLLSDYPHWDDARQPAPRPTAR